MKCTQCDATGLARGFLSDFGQYSRDSRWAEGVAQTGVFGRIKKAWSMPKWTVDAYCCPECGHLELFTGGRCD